MVPFTIQLLLCALISIQYACADSVAGPAVFNGEEWVSVAEDTGVAVNAGNGPARPHPPIGTGDGVDTSHLDIFVGILQFRDPRCGLTLHRLFGKAAHPERVHVGMVQQRSSTDAECLRDYCQLHGASPTSDRCPHLNQIKIINANQFDAKSFSRGRALLHTLRSDEVFCMSIEVSSDFIASWDEELISMWHRAGNEYAILSTYPPITTSSIEDVIKYSTENNNEVPHLCQAAYYSTAGDPTVVAGSLQAYSQSHGIVENLTPRTAVHLTRPLLTTLYSAAFSFGRCHAEAKVPWDPTFENIHKGDDFLKFARLWTRGYDMYTPNKVVVVLDSSHVPTLVGSREAGVQDKDRFDPAGWLKNGMTQQIRSRHREDGFTRHNTILGSRKHYWDSLENKYGGSSSVSSDDLLRITRFGLGSKRTLDQFISFTGIDTRNRIVTENTCGRRGPQSWVPFARDVHVECEDGDPWGMAPERLLSSAPTGSAAAIAAADGVGAWSGIQAGSADADLFHFVFHGNNLPLTSRGHKSRLSISAAAGSGVGAGAGAVAVPNPPANVAPPPPQAAAQQQPPQRRAPTAFTMLWQRFFGWWVDDWVSLTEQLIATQMREDSEHNAVRITQLMLVTFPILLCVLTALIFPLCSGEGDDGDSEESGNSDSDGDDQMEEDYYDGDDDLGENEREEEDEDEAGFDEESGRGKDRRLKSATKEGFLRPSGAKNVSGGFTTPSPHRKKAVSSHGRRSAGMKSK